MTAINATTESTAVRSRIRQAQTVVRFEYASSPNNGAYEEKNMATRNGRRGIQRRLRRRGPDCGEGHRAHVSGSAVGDRMLAVAAPHGRLSVIAPRRRSPGAAFALSVLTTCDRPRCAMTLTVG